MEIKNKNLQDELTGALIGLVRAADGTATPTESTYQALIEGLYATCDSTSFDQSALEAALTKVRLEKYKLAPDCSTCASPCGRTADYDMNNLWNAQEPLRSVKTDILSELRQLSISAYRNSLNGQFDPAINRFLCEALFKIGYEETADALRPILSQLKELQAN